MWAREIPEIHKGAKVIVGLGDSFTEGVGSWNEETYRKFKGRIDPLNIPDSIKPEMYENSWVSQLCNRHLYGWLPVNLGMMGRGNRAALKELYLNPKIKFSNASEVIVVYMLSGMERFDFISRDFPENSHFFAMWPNPWDKNTTNKKLWEAYAEDIWSERFVALETLLNIKEAEMICRANGWKLIITSAFDQRITRDNFVKVINKPDEDHAELVDSIPWDCFLYPQDCNSFMHLLLKYAGHENHEELALGAYHDYYSKLAWPAKYITNCMHPSREGYGIMAQEIFKFIKEKNYA
jgi:lysophospholipase L1-like esterase